MAETIDHLIGQRLAHARAEAGLTLRELGARLNWDHSTLSSYETGRRSLSLPRLIALAHALGRSPSALLASSEETAQLIERIERQGGHTNLLSTTSVGNLLQDEPTVPTPPQQGTSMT
ncbi:helix-turn-helix domain-containing protein [Candidatus Chloroploca asiatica]|uniref:HTH cro/C1-type domain-containing protein n=1 Tax=Candidatus Chloroploca asiatica TaxID=1506545 RepID=A0A2H3KGG6_9CHLR|nr:helix-turn-helix transcriptional regulator [Candidatus Chloroploca asiatica]PDV96814.1 hypothetical protein A9Q02_20260 [Candidatus Chloroploca asiatica]